MKAPSFPKMERHLIGFGKQPGASWMKKSHGHGDLRKASESTCLTSGLAKNDHEKAERVCGTLTAGPAVSPPDEAETPAAAPVDSEVTGEAQAP